MEAVFCNKCNQFQKNVAHYIWHCRHITCEKCIKKPVCPVCGVSSKPTNYAKVAGDLQNPLRQFEHFQKLCKLSVEQDARMFDYFVNKLPVRMQEVDRKLKEVQKEIKDTQAAIEKEEKRGEKMKQFLQYAERNNLDSFSSSQSFKPETPPLTPSSTDNNESLNDFSFLNF